MEDTGETLTNQPENTTMVSEKTDYTVIKESAENDTSGEYDPIGENFSKDDGEKKSSGERDREGNIASSADSEGRSEEITRMIAEKMIVRKRKKDK